MPHDHAPASISPCCIDPRIDAADLARAMSPNVIAAPSSRSFSSRRSTPALMQHALGVAQRAHHQPRVELGRRHERLLDVVVHRRFLVAMKRVPMFMPSAPSASAATRLAAVRHAARGDERHLQLLRRPRGSRMKFGMSSSPGWPPHSKPSTLTASQPMRLGLQRVAHRRALVDHLDAVLACSAGSHFCGIVARGLDDRTPLSMIALDEARVVGRRANAGRKVRFTPNGWSVIVPAAADLRGQFSGVPCVSP